MRAIVAGAAGFLGSHLCDAILDSGGTVLGIDNLCTGRFSNIERLTQKTTFELYDLDVAFLEPDDSKKLEKFKPSHVFNLAAIASPPIYVQHQIDTCWTSAGGSMNLLDVAQIAGARYIATSTSEVYGDPEENPQTEDYWGHVNPTGPRSCYDEGKRFAEALAFAFHRELGTNIGILRLFNTYGPRMNPVDGRVVSNFIRQALNNEPLTIYGDGSQTRSLCYVDDTIDGIMKMANSTITGPVNIGNPNEMTILDIADAVCQVVCNDPGRIHTIGVGDDPQVRCPDVTYAKNVLGWAPSTPLSEGLAKMVEEFRGTIECLTA